MKMNTQEVTLLVILNLSAVLIRLIITSFLHVWMRSSGYVDWPWNGSGRTWRKEVSKSPSTDLSQSALVWSVVTHRGHVWAPYFSSTMHASYSRWLRINFHTRIAMRMTQIYLSFKPISNISQEDAVHAMECCIEKIRRWPIHDRLLLNDDKTEFIIIGTRQQLKKLQAMNIKVGGSVIKPSSQVKNLGSWFDPNLNMRHHITNVCKAGFFYLHNIRRIKKYLSRDSLLTLVHAFITSRLDYCNALLYGLPKEQIFKLQRVQNAAARLIMDIGKYSHITPALYELHWLPVLARIHFKILLLAFKAIHGLVPEYISNLLVIKRKSSYNSKRTDSKW